MRKILPRCSLVVRVAAGDTSPMSIVMKAIEQLEAAKPPREAAYRYAVKIRRDLRDSYLTAIKDRAFLMGLTIDIAARENDDEMAREAMRWDEVTSAAGMSYDDKDLP